MSFVFHYRATITLGGNHIYFFGVQMPDEYADKKVKITVDYLDSAWSVIFTPSIDQSEILLSSYLKTGTMTADRFVDPGKCYLLMGNNVGTAAFIDVSALIDVDGGGVVSLKSGIINTAQQHVDFEVDIAQVVGGTGTKLLATDASGDVIEIAVTPTQALVLSSLESDIALLSGLDAGGVTNVDLLALSNMASVLDFTADGIIMKAGKQITMTTAPQRVSRSLSGSASILTTDDIIVLSVPATVPVMTLPSVATTSNQVKEFIIRLNTTPSNVTFTADGADSIIYNGSENVSHTLITPAAGTTIKLVNYAVVSWILV